MVIRGYGSGFWDQVPIGWAERNVHIEGNNTDHFYHNYMKCEVFGHLPADCVVQDDETMRPRWTHTAGSDVGFWDGIDGCSCIQENSLYDENGEYKYCYATKKREPNVVTVSSVNVTLHYTRIPEYYCTECIPGAVAVVSSPHPAATGSCKKPEGSDFTVCNCTVADKGWYVDTCTWQYPLSEEQMDTCQINACPAGQTTDSTGSTSVDACHYTADTQFCDAAGCFSINDIQNWTPVP